MKQKFIRLTGAATRTPVYIDFNVVTSMQVLTEQVDNCAAKKAVEGHPRDKWDEIAKTLPRITVTAVAQIGDETLAVLETPEVILCKVRDAETLGQDTHVTNLIFGNKENPQDLTGGCLIR